MHFYNPAALQSKSVPVKILLQHQQTRLYLKDPESWVADPQAAAVFQTSASALAFCRTHQLNRIDILLKFDNRIYDLAIAVPRLLAQETRP